MLIRNVVQSADSVVTLLTLEAKQLEPVLRAGLNANDLKRTLTPAFAPFDGARVVPKDKEAQVGLEGFQIAGILTTVQKGLGCVHNELNDGPL